MTTRDKLGRKERIGNIYSVIPLLGMEHWDFVFEFYRKVTNTGIEYSLQAWGWEKE